MNFNPTEPSTVMKEEMKITIPPDIPAIGQRLLSQDNRCTDHPMFCVQRLKAESGFDLSYSDDFCWWNAEQCEIQYDTPPEGWDEDGRKEQNGWEKFGYKTYWETVMTAFTEEGCNEYLRLNGHNDRRAAHKGHVRIYAESFNRCPEMVALRKFLMEVASRMEVQP